MARLLMTALERAGHRVELASHLRAFLPDASAPAIAKRQLAAQAETARISALWTKTGAPAAWICYHPYYKAPDLIGPALARRFDMDYVTVEASYSTRRNRGEWTSSQASVIEAVKSADLNICMTRRDRDGLAAAAPDARLALLSPFIDPSAMADIQPVPQAGRLICVAMMRAGDKMDSYAMLAEALALLPHRPWTLDIVGDGPRVMDVRALFARFAPGRVVWHGERSPAEIVPLLSRASIYVWPGCGEAYGLAYLEAQAAGLPVVAQAIAGVPEVVENEGTGLLTPPGNIAAYAQAIGRLLEDEPQRSAFGQAARVFVLNTHSLDQAARRLGSLLATHLRAR